MKKNLKIVLAIAPVLLLSALKDNTKRDTTEHKASIIVSEPNTAEQLWKDCGLESKLNKEVFALAINGQKQIEGLRNTQILTIIDFTKKSTEKRCFIIDLENKKLLFHTLVAHGKNSGDDITNHFSNTPQSQASSLGFYKTAETYFGKHGLSLRLDGLEAGFNHNARTRAVVVHGANYVNESFAKIHGRLGRSWGCPALPQELSEAMIKTIANGTCLFIYGNDEGYMQQSRFINP